MLAAGLLHLRSLFILDDDRCPISPLTRSSWILRIWLKRFESRSLAIRSIIIWAAFVVSSFVFSALGAMHWVSLFWFVARCNSRPMFISPVSVWAISPPVSFSFPVTSWMPIRWEYSTTNCPERTPTPASFSSPARSAPALVFSAFGFVSPSPLIDG